MRRNYDGIINNFDLKNFILNYSQSKFVKSQVNNSQIDHKEKKVVFKRIKEGKKITGFIPYSGQLTGITIYNFFSTNYGDRGKGSIFISLTDENFNIIKSFHKEVRLRETLNINSDEFKLHEGNSSPIFCVVSLISNKINRNHGNFFGNFRFWGNWSDYSAFVHSFPLNSLRLLSSKFGITKDIFLDRMYYPRNAQEVLHYGIHKKPISITSRGDISGTLKVSPGYTFIKDFQGNVSSVHHLSTYYRKTALKNDTSYKENIIGIPPIKNLDVEIFFGEYCSNGSKIKLTLLQKNSHIENDSINEIESILHEFESASTSLRASKIFSKFANLQKDIESWITIEPQSGKFRRCYVNISYCHAVTKQTYDAVHALNITDNKKYESRSLKFAPCLISSNKNKLIKRDSFLMIVGNRNFDTRARLRFYNSSDTYNEFIYLLNIPKLCPKMINLNDILPSSFNDESLIICQLESEESNLDACMFISKFQNGEIKSMGTDHLTGG